MCDGRHERHGNDVDENLGEPQHAPRDCKQQAKATAEIGEEELEQAEHAGDNGREDEQTMKAELKRSPAHPQPI